MFKNLKTYLIFIIPLFFKYIFLSVFIDWSLFDIEDIKEDMLFFVAIFILLKSNIVKKQVFLDFICLVYLLYMVLETTSYMAVSSNFSSSYMYLLIESNQQELKEFTASYISFPIVLFIILSVVLFFYLRKRSFKTSNKWSVFTGVTSFFIIVIILKFTGLIESNVYHNIVRGAYGYIELQKSVKLNSDIKKDDITINTENEVFVFVMGESTARNHMQLYGYYRENTPLLSTIKTSLFVYDNVISTDVLTLKALPKMLTSLDVNSNPEKNVYNLVEVFNEAGFDTYWLSNQRAISYHDNAISKIASGSKELKFYNHLIDKHAVVLDEVVFPDYKSILSKPGKKVVFVRLIGTHFNYDNRYPESFNKFDVNKVQLSKKETINNQYDNAVLYNDFIVHSLIKSLDEINRKSALIYVSDHGENVYDDATDFFGRNEEVITKSMFEIPFILWTSKSFEFPKDFVYKENRSFMADHTYESIGHIFGVVHKSIDIKKSIFSNSFVPRKRKVIDNTIDFNTYFSVKNE